MAFTKVVGAGIHTLSNITSHNIHSSGIVTATALDISGNATIGGVLTYEDVTSIDSVGLVTAREGVFIPDNKKLQLGNAAGNADLQIYHSGSHSFIQDEGTGNLYIDANQFYLRQANNDTVLFQTISNGEVRINHNGNTRLTTTNDGVDIGGISGLVLLVSGLSYLLGLIFNFKGAGVILTLLPIVFLISVFWTKPQGQAFSLASILIFGSGIFLISFKLFTIPAIIKPLLPDQPVSESADSDVKLLAFNLRRSGVLPKNGIKDPRKLAKIINDEDVEIVLFQGIPNKKFLDDLFN